MSGVQAVAHGLASHGTGIVHEGPSLSNEKRHLVVLVNGLYGNSGNWETIVEKLQEHLDSHTTVLYSSSTNQYAKTFDGIDSCGERLAAEVRQVVADHPRLERISLVGHSMGGLIARYAIGVLYDPGTGKVAGLHPSHFVSIASPHLGCDVVGAAQVPLIGWTARLPAYGTLIQGFLQQWAAPVTAGVLSRTGQQLFLRDNAHGGSERPTPTLPSPQRQRQRQQGGELQQQRSSGGKKAAAPSGASQGPTEGGGAAAERGASGESPRSSRAPLPLLCRMANDVAGEGYFFSGLEAFDTRTCYANTSGDHLVGPSNSSLRAPEQLPSISTRGRGVVREDPLAAAFTGALPASASTAAMSSAAASVASVAAAADGAAASAGFDTMGQKRSRSSGWSSAAGGFGAAGAGGSRAGQRLLSSSGAEGSGSQGKASQQQRQKTPPVAESPHMSSMLTSLQRLPWRRIDVCFKGAAVPFLAHNHIQVTKKWVNSEGEGVASHVALQMAAMDAELGRRKQAAASEAVAVQLQGASSSM